MFVLEEVEKVTNSVKNDRYLGISVFRLLKSGNQKGVLGILCKRMKFKNLDTSDGFHYPCILTPICTSISW